MHPCHACIEQVRGANICGRQGSHWLTAAQTERKCIDWMRRRLTGVDPEHAVPQEGGGPRVPHRAVACLQHLVRVQHRQLVHLGTVAPLARSLREPESCEAQVIWSEADRRRQQLLCRLPAFPSLQSACNLRNALVQRPDSSASTTSRNSPCLKVTSGRRCALSASLACEQA